MERSDAEVELSSDTEKEKMEDDNLSAAAAMANILSTLTGQSEHMNNISSPIVNPDSKDEIIALMQAQIDVQSERISKNEAMIQDLILQVQELKLALTISDKGGAAVEKAVESDWTSSNTDQPLSMSIAEMVKATAEETIAQSGFVYDENSGLYYDHSSGMYYDSSRSLYYNGHTRTYYTIDPETQQYLLHSQLPPLGSKVSKKRSKKLNRNEVSEMSSKPKYKPDDKVKKENEVNSSVVKVKRPVDDDIEDGELSSSSSVSIIEQESSNSDASHGTVVLDDDEDWDRDLDASSNEHAPCIRAIVLESTVPELKKGFLFLVTCTGGTIGREGSEHTILIPDPMISKNHAKITYDFEEVSVTGTNGHESNSIPQKNYLISDLASMNGTYLNGKRLSEPLIYSDPSPIPHGSILIMGGTKILMHIHSGQLTCGHCEPGLILIKEPMYGGATGKNHKENTRKKQLKKMRKKYGIQGSQTGRIPNSLDYQDRAGERRQTQGSDNPYEKTEVASIDQAIKEDNKGFKMMSKMGWSSGDSLGQTKDSGIREPVKFEVRLGRAGLGAELPAGAAVSHQQKSNFKQKYRTDILQKTIKRYISPPSSTSTGNITIAPGPGSSVPTKSEGAEVIDID